MGGHAEEGGWRKREAGKVKIMLKLHNKVLLIKSSMLVVDGNCM